MKNIGKVLWITIAISVLLLFVFAYSQTNAALFLKLDSKWIIVAFLPILLGLMYKGVIESINFGVLKVKLRVKDINDFQEIAAIEISRLPDGIKGPTDNLNRLTEEQKDSIKRLKFISGNPNYNSDDIKKYLASLKIEYFEIIDGTGQFISVIPLIDNGRINQERGENMDELLIQYLLKRINNVIQMDPFREISESINWNESLIEAYGKFASSTQIEHINNDKSNQFLPVLNKQKKMIGIIRRFHLTENIAKQIYNTSCK